MTDEVRICPRCRAVVEPTIRGNVGAHLAAGRPCPIGGQPYLIALRPAEVVR